MASFRITNFGCRAAQADGATLKAQLLEAGFTEASRSGPADLAILNTCTVTATADAEVRQVIRRIHRDDPQCRVLVTGCYAQRAPTEIADLEGVSWVVGNSHKARIPEILRASASRKSGGEPVFSRTGQEKRIGGCAAEGKECRAQIWVGEIPAQFHFVPVSADDRTRPTLKVQDGCDARCSYCIIPAVRGRSRSLPLPDAIFRIRALEAKGYREVVLSGINLGGYGRDLQPRVTFLSLLENILEKTSVARLRISSIEPMDVGPELIRLVAREPRMAKHFHVPLQSGCDRMLRQMNRRYWTAHYAERILAIHETMPHGALGADVMAGFPGETREDYEASMRFIDALPFTYLHVFPYSARPSTPAAIRGDQVNGRIVHARARELRSLAERKRRRFAQAQVGRRLSVLTLHADGQGSALSSNYLKVFLPGFDLPPNEFVDVRIESAEGGELRGRPEPLTGLI